MLIDDHKRNKYMPRARIISGIVLIPFPLLAILLNPFLDLGDAFYFAVSIATLLMAGAVSGYIFDRLIDRDDSTFFGKIIIRINDLIWSNDP